MAEPYIPKKEANQSYRPVNNVRTLLTLHLLATKLTSFQLMSDGLRRAREPFRLRNALTGVGLAAFAFGVWAYSIGAVKQDVFDDVDEEARALSRSGLKSIEDQEAEKQVVAATTDDTTAGLRDLPPTFHPAPVKPDTVSANVSRGRGVLPRLLDGRFPRLLDPSTKTLVWGAPSVDSIGRVWDKRRS